MHESFLRALQTYRPELRLRWEVLLRSERTASPLAHPDTLVHLMDWTLDRLWDELRQPQFRRHSRNHDQRGTTQLCACGKNPLLTYFTTAEQAIIETLFVDEQDLAGLSGVERSASLEDLKGALHAVGRREIESFCAVCQSNQRQQELVYKVPSPSTEPN